jgi:hypothetical protein
VQEDDKRIRLGRIVIPRDEEAIGERAGSIAEAVGLGWFAFRATAMARVEDWRSVARSLCWVDVRKEYEAGLAEFEKRNFQHAARILANLRDKCPDDGPALLLLSRAVNCMVKEPPLES